MMELVVRCHGDNRAPGRADRVENLRRRVQPNLNKQKNSSLKFKNKLNIKLI